MILNEYCQIIFKVFDMLKPKHKNHLRNMELLVEAFQQNYQQILQFLPWEQHATTKLICRGVYYLSITNDIWTGLRYQVIDKKMEVYQDLDFVEEQSKHITKQQKRIRIHSLKKNATGKKIRQASNVKDKKIALNTINNQLPFRSTQVGFKRLLRSQIGPKPKISSSKEIANVMMDLVQIPKQWSAKDLVIDVKDPWSINLQRAHNLSEIARKWNQFHHRIITELKEVEKDLSNLVKKCIKVDKNTSDYLIIFEKQPYKTIRQLFDGAQQHLLIDDQLNKLGRIFVKNHNQLVLIGRYLQPFISKTHEACSKLNHQNSNQTSNMVVQSLLTLEQIVDQWSRISKQCPCLVHYLAKSLLQIVDSLVTYFFSIEIDVAEDSFPIFEININHLSKRPDYFQVIFDSYERICGGLLKLCEGGEEENMGLNLTAGKFKNLKMIAHHLWSISKYFTKLTKQLDTKTKKGSVGGKGLIIKNFLQSYQNYKTSQTLIDWKYPNRAEKEVNELKQRVSNLKSMMQGE